MSRQLMRGFVSLQRDYYWCPVHTYPISRIHWREESNLNKLNQQVHDFFCKSFWQSHTAFMLGELDPCGGGDPIPLTKPKLLIGRQDFCDVVLRYPNVSSRHCEMEFKDGYWFIRDLGSSNGIRVGGIRCQERHLVPGDELWIARYRFNIHYELDAAQPPQQAKQARGVLDRSLMEKAGLNKRPSESTRTVRSPRLSRETTLGELIPCGGGNPIALSQMRLTVGRHPQCEIVLPFGTVSARHCELELIEGYWMVRDLGSRNGTRVDGVRVDEKWLMPGNILWVHKHRFEVDYTPLTDKPPPSEKSVSMARSLLDKAGLSRRQT